MHSHALFDCAHYNITTQSITDAALYYVDEVYKKVDTCFSKDGKFIATVQLCIILNNMQTIQDKLSPPDFPPDDTTGSKPVGIIDELGLQEFFDWLEQERKIGLKLKEFVNKTMYNAADDIHHKICMVTSQLGKQVSENVFSLFALRLDHSFTPSSFQIFRNSWEIFCRHVEGLHL